MHGHERIEGAEKLTGVFGKWPSFHDANVIWVRLDRRRPPKESTGRLSMP